MRIAIEDIHVDLIENGVPVHEQTMSLEKVFWVFFTANLCLATLLVGVLVAGIGLGPAASIALFSASPVYTSPVAKLLGGVDIGYYVGFVVAGAWYWLALRYGRPSASETVPEIVPA
jgi:purine-cytosine permease-like protein